MKKITKFIDNIRAPLFALLILFVAGNVHGQGEELTGKRNENIVKPQNLNTCGSYPASGIFVEAISTVNTAKGCATVITPGSATVYFIARDKIILSPGFIAQSGSNFVAYLDSSRELMSDAATSVNQSEITEKINKSAFTTPNPFRGSFTLSINLPKDEKTQVTIYNSFGVKMKQQTNVNLSKGINNISFDCSNFASGIYMLEVNFGDSKIVKKIIKIN